VWCGDAEGGEESVSEPKRGRKPRIIDPGGFGLVVGAFPSSEVFAVARRAETRGCATTEGELESILVDPERERSRLAPRTVLQEHWFSSKAKWLEADGGTWKRKDHINLGEGRSTLRALEISACNSYFHRTRVLGLSDSRVVVGSFSKGRSPFRKLNRLIQRCSSIQLGTGMQVLLAWVITTWNPANRLSRDKAGRNVFETLRQW
jgi:hypothetical protein